MAKENKRMSVDQLSPEALAEYKSISTLPLQEMIVDFLEGRTGGHNVTAKDVSNILNEHNMPHLAQHLRGLPEPVTALSLTNQYMAVNFCLRML